MSARYAGISRLSPGWRELLTLLAVAPTIFMGLAAPSAANELSHRNAAAQFNAPNPAAHYCVQLGYSYEIIKTETGQRGICILPNGERVDAWDFFRGECGRDSRDGGDNAPTVRREAVGDAPFDLPDEWLPGRFDWREHGGCTPIKDQGTCGSCWAFSTVAALESAILINDGDVQDLSEQWLISCNQDGWHCGGGSFAHNYHMWKTDPCGKTGAVLEADFPYAAEDLPCDCPYRHPYEIDDWGYVGNSESIPPLNAIKRAILDYGPVSVEVATDDAFASYSGGIFDDCSATGVNHLVVIVGWDDSQGTAGVWFLRNSWGTGWGEDGYMRIEYGCNHVGHAANWVHYPTRQKIVIDFPEGLPEARLPGEPTGITVRIRELRDEYIEGSGMLRYRHAGDDFAATPLIASPDGLFRAVLPPAYCNDVTEYYFSVEGVTTGPICCPADAPATTYSSLAGSLTTIFTDDFETDTGWTVENDPHLIAGAWERGIPVGGGNGGDPPTDGDGSGTCYLTDNRDGNSDVDLGITWLISPAFDLAGCENAKVSYLLWYTNLVGNDPRNDLFKIHVSNNDGAEWTKVGVVGPHSRFGWTARSFMLGDFVELTSQVRVRFEASDLNDISIVEAGIDDFQVKILECEPRAAAGRGAAEPQLVLHPNSPNPFSAHTLIRYRLPRTAPVTLSVYGIDGRLLRALIDLQQQGTGIHRVNWDGRDDLGQRAPSGVYYCRLDVDGESLTKKMIVVE